MITTRTAARERVRDLLATQPRTPLALLPTPLHPLPRLSEALGGPQIWVKRDDLTGMAFGGNKTRQLEFVLGDLLRQEPEVLVTGANIQSNWSRQSAAAAARLGVPIVLVLRNSEMQEIQGNVLLDYWLGADVRFTSEPDMTKVMRGELDRVVEELRADGRRALKIDPWGPPVSLSYVDMLVELDEQCEALDLRPTRDLDGRDRPDPERDGPGGPVDRLGRQDHRGDAAHLDGRVGGGPDRGWRQCRRRVARRLRSPVAVRR